MRNCLLNISDNTTKKRIENDAEDTNCKRPLAPSCEAVVRRKAHDGDERIAAVPPEAIQALDMVKHGDVNIGSVVEMHEWRERVAARERLADVALVKRLPHEERSGRAQQGNRIVPAEYRVFEELPERVEPKRAGDDAREVAVLVLEPPG